MWRDATSIWADVSWRWQPIWTNRDIVACRLKWGAANTTDTYFPGGINIYLYVLLEGVKQNLVLLVFYSNIITSFLPWYIGFSNRIFCHHKIAAKQTNERATSWYQKANKTEQQKLNTSKNTKLSLHRYRNPKAHARGNTLWGKLRDRQHNHLDHNHN